MRRHTRFPRSAWTVFRRIHLTALAADWRRTTLSVVGVMLGVVVMLGVTVLQSSLVRPFDAFGPSLTHAAGPGVLEVTPEVSGRLPLDLMNRIREEVPDARAVVPVVVGLTPVEIGGSTRGFFVLGGSCDVELLFGSFNCERRAKEEKPADGPGIPLEIPEVIARRDNLHLGDEVRLPGQPPGAAHLGWTFPEFDRVAGVNEGSVIMTPSLGAAASLLGAPGYSTIVFVLPKPGAQIPAEVAKAVGNLGSVGPPRAQQPLVLALSAQAYNLMMLAGIVIGFLIAVNTVLLAVEDRRPVFGTVGAIGARPLGLFAGLLGEGVLIGLAGSLAAVPGGFLLGSFLVDRFARSLLSGSGGLVVARFEPSLFATGALSGVACGVLAMMGPAWQLFRQGPFASMASFGGTQRIRTTPLWSLVVGLALLGHSARGRLGRAPCCAVVGRTFIGGEARSGAAAQSGHTALRDIARDLGRRAHARGQPGDRLSVHAGARGQADRRAESGSALLVFADIGAVGARSA
jgi:putative ABC transport system permease protein